jgi:predicted pyridoxine 5'-phosphate oxidase superfamily flavin-nucleotide-binding protein
MPRSSRRSSSRRSSSSAPPSFTSTRKRGKSSARTTRAVRELQDRFDTRRLADRLEERAARHIRDDDRAFIEARDMFFLATADAEGRPAVLVQGRRAGLRARARRAHDRVPELRRNGRSCRWETRSRTRTSACSSSTSRDASGFGLNGVASVRLRRSAALGVAGGAVRRARAGDRGVPELPALHPRVPARAALPLRARRQEAETPVPAWKRTDWAQDVLPEHDPARDPSRESIPR